MGSTAEYTGPAPTGDSPSSGRAAAAVPPEQNAAPSPDSNSPSGSRSSQPAPRPPVEVAADDATVIRPPEKLLGVGGNAPAGGTIVPAPSHELSKLLAGERLGNYELLEFAGGGGMGAVFRAARPDAPSRSGH
ncbi:MAG: hypothetical protein QM775_25830 [Pirellulales bacterium]